MRAKGEKNTKRGRQLLKKENWSRTQIVTCETYIFRLSSSLDSAFRVAVFCGLWFGPSRAETNPSCTRLGTHRERPRSHGAKDLNGSAERGWGREVSHHMSAFMSFTSSLLSSLKGTHNVPHYNPRHGITCYAMHRGWKRMF